ncbi:hypothetical protein OIO90_002939 [Microbotryomycetes sp. JL221]|nr:hypothetical protein OIO90_002939 [Microbotryomycetes sp. JL221]
MSSSTSTHVCIIGTGISALSCAKTLLSNGSATRLKLTLIDKAKQPGGRLTSRIYDKQFDTTLETGLRVFQLRKDHLQTERFKDQVQEWTKRGWIKKVDQNKLKGVGTQQQGLEWFEAVGGVTKGLINNLVDEIKDLTKDNVDWHFNTTVVQPSPNSTTNLALSLDPQPSQPLEPIDIVIHTAPVPQTVALLPSSISIDSVTNYAQTFVWLLPTIDTSLLRIPIYHRQPHAKLTSIATGTATSDDKIVKGLVLQATPQQLGLEYDREKTTDQDIKQSFLKVLKSNLNTTEQTHQLFQENIIKEIENKKGRESQIKRWKFAQVEIALDNTVGRDDEERSRRIKVFANGRVIVAGDGTDTGLGGVQGAWLAGTEAAQHVLEWISNNSKL